MIAIKVHYEGDVPGLAKRWLNEVKKRAYAVMGRYWHQHFLEKHFTKAGAQEYGYAKRAGEGEVGKAFWSSYTGRKQKKWGHTLALVYSGASRSRARQMDVRATSKGVNIVLHAPALNYKNEYMGMNMSEEIRTITSSEADRLAEAFDAEMVRGLRAMQVSEDVIISSRGNLSGKAFVL
jgi:hypothetical protein